MIEQAEPSEYIAGENPTEEELFYKEWAKETTKRSMATLNDALQRLVTIDVTLLGGGIVFLNDTLIGRLAKVVALSLFFASFCMAFWGLMPFPVRVCYVLPDDFRAQTEAAREYKDYRLRCAIILLGLGFAAAIVGVMIRGGT